MSRGRSVVLAGVALLAMSSSSLAGGFQRGIADTDILFEQGAFASRFGVTYLDPHRGFTSLNGEAVDPGDMTGSYTIPSHSIYFGTDEFGCAGTFTKSFAAEVDYNGLPGGALPQQNASAQGITNTERLDFSNAAARSRTKTIGYDSNEVGGTCRLSYSTGGSRFSLIGGVFVEDFNFKGTSLGFRNLTPQIAASGAAGARLAAVVAAAVPGGQITLPTAVDVDTDGDYEPGFRLGFAYEMPEIALRVQGLYRSEVVHDGIRGTGTVEVIDTAYVSLDGQRVSVPTAIGGAVAGVASGIGLSPGTTIAVDSAVNDSISPQSFTLSAQTGIAEGTLLLGSFRWTDWSTNEAVVSTISSARTGTTSSYLPFNWRDGYTASLGIGRAFNEQVSGLISLGYDRGVSTGADTIYTDVYTLSGGVSLKPEKFAELRFGGLVGYWTDGEQRIDDGAYFDADVGGDFVWAVNASLKLSF